MTSVYEGTVGAVKPPSAASGTMVEKAQPGVPVSCKRVSTVLVMRATCVVRLGDTVRLTPCVRWSE